MRSLAMISHDGNVFWPPIVRFRSACKIDITFFPWDDQICHLKLGSWAYDGFQVDVTNRSDNVDLSSYSHNGEWELMDVRAKRNVVYYPCCPEPFPDVTFFLHIRRRTLYYSFNVIIPCVMLSMLSLSGFLLPAASGEKVTLGLTVLLAFSVFMLLIAESMPATSEFVPLIGIYLTVVMAMTSISVICGVFVLHLHHQGSRLQRAPAWVRRWALDYLSRVLMVKVNKYAIDVPPPFSNQCEMVEVNCNGATRLSTGNFTYGYETTYNTCAANVTNVQERRKSSVRERELERPSIKKRKVDNEMVSLLRNIVERQEQADEETRVTKEWEEIACVVDRLFFTFFFALGLISTVALLILKPLAKNVSIDTYKPVG